MHVVIVAEDGIHCSKAKMLVIVTFVFSLPKLVNLLPLSCSNSFEISQTL